MIRRHSTRVNRNLNGSVEKQNLWAIKRGKQPMAWTLQGLLFNVVIQQPSITNCAFLRCLQGYSPEFEAQVASLGQSKYLEALHEYEPRSVFTRFHAERVEPGAKLDPARVGMERIFYNPTKGDTFHHFFRSKKVQVDSLDTCYMDAQGRMWGRQ
jgi:hypothetical protein